MTQIRKAFNLAIKKPAGRGPRAVDLGDTTPEVVNISDVYDLTHFANAEMRKKGWVSFHPVNGYGPYTAHLGNREEILKSLLPENRQGWRFSGKVEGDEDLALFIKATGIEIPKDLMEEIREGVMITDGEFISHYF